MFGGGEDVSSNDGAAITAALSVICLETDLFETVVVAVGIEEERNLAVDSYGESATAISHVIPVPYIVPTLLWPIASQAFCNERSGVTRPEKSCHLLTA